jgi:hypothetical protein
MSITTTPPYFGWLRLGDAVARLDEIPGISLASVYVILAEIGTDMTRFPTAGHLTSWARLAPGIKESAGKKKKKKKKGKGSTGHGNACLASILGNATTGAAKTDTFLGERYRRIAWRRGPSRSPRLHRQPPARRLPAHLLREPGSAKALPGAAARQATHRFSDWQPVGVVLCAEVTQPATSRV